MTNDDVQQSALKMLSERIKVARVNAGLSQTALGKLMGVSKQTVSSWERGIAPPLITNLLKFSALMGIDIRDLLSGLSDDLTVHAFTDHRIGAVSTMLPLYSNEEECGAVIMDLEVVEPKRFVATTQAHGKKDVSFTVTSKANEPKVYVGDRVDLRVGVEPDPGKFVFACVRGKFILRRYLPKVSNSHVDAVLKAENPAFPPEIMGKDDRIIGVVSEFVSYSHD